MTLVFRRRVLAEAGPVTCMTFGDGVIDADGMASALIDMRRALKRGDNR